MVFNPKLKRTVNIKCQVAILYAIMEDVELPKKVTEEKSKLNQTKTQNNSLKKILKEVVTLIAGKQAEDIVDLLDTKKHINEFIIAKKLDLTINQTRNILYKISDHGLVSYIRKKDKKKGWYTYFWKIEILKSLEFMKNNLLKRIDQLEHKIKSRETKNLDINILIVRFKCSYDISATLYPLKPVS